MSSGPLSARAGAGWRSRAALRARPLGVLVLLALAVRLALVAATPHFVPVTDAADFQSIAATLARTGSFPPSAVVHGGPTALRPPLFPAVLAGVYRLVGDSPQAGRVLEALLGACAVWLVGLIASRLWSARVGLVAAAIAAVFPPLVLVGSSLLSEPLFIALVLGAVWAALVFRAGGRFRWAASAGALVGLASLTRGNGFLLVVPVGLLTFHRPRRSWNAFRAPALVVTAAVLVLVPWTVRNLSAFHRFVPLTTEAGYGLAGTYNAASQRDPRLTAMYRPPVAQLRAELARDPGANEAQASQALLDEGLAYIRRHPASLPRTLYWNALRLANLTGAPIERGFARPEGYPVWLAVLSVYAFWLLLALAAAGALLRATREAPLALWGCPLLIVASAAALLGLTRYRSPADPFLIMPAALAVLAGWDLVRTARPGSRRREPVPVPSRPA